MATTFVLSWASKVMWENKKQHISQFNRQGQNPLNKQKTQNCLKPTYLALKLLCFLNEEECNALLGWEKKKISFHSTLTQKIRNIHCFLLQQKKDTGTYQLQSHHLESQKSSLGQQTKKKSKIVRRLYIPDCSFLTKNMMHYDFTAMHS